MNEQIKCECCGKSIKEGKEVWLKLSNTDGKYYLEFPKGHISQGDFSFGSTCAKNTLKQ